MKKKNKHVDKQDRQFDFERWLRQTINGGEAVRLIDGERIIEGNGDTIGDTVGTYGKGGVIVGKSGTDGVVRWAPYPWVSYETVTHHLLKQTLITHVMLSIEEDHGNPQKLRGEKLLPVALTHDLSEIVGEGDVNYHVKNASVSSRALHKRKDRLQHDAVLSSLHPEWRSYFPHPPDVNGSFPEIERSFWEAAEYIGYCLFMLEEVRLGNISPEHVALFMNNTERYIGLLEKVTDTFASVREFLDREIVPKWERLR